MADSTKPGDASASRRNFLKIGAGVVAGAAVASVVEIPYYSSVIGSNNSDSSTTVSSLQSQLSATTSQLSDTQSSLSAAQGTISTLNNQLSSTQSQLGAVQSSLSSATSQNAALNQQLTATQGSLTSANGQITSLQSQVTSASSQVTSLQTQIGMTSGFLTLNPTEVSLVEAVAETIIPTDSTGPGAKEAGVIYFIDRQLASEWGNDARMYVKGPFVAANQTAPVTVNGVTYPNGSPITRPFTGISLNYPFTTREFWRRGLEYLDSYANSQYGSGFASLNSQQQTQVLQDLWNNKPTNFEGPTPFEFFVEANFLVWAGFLTDPLYGGNGGMVGWNLTGFAGTNTGDAYGEGYTSIQLATMKSPVKLKPQSLAQLQGGA